MQVFHLPRILSIVGLLWCLECSADEACSDAAIPGLSTCFGGQPAMKLPSCYNATRSIAIPYDFGNGDTLSVGCRKVDFDTGSPGSFKCKDGVWEQEVAAPSCLAERLSAWRLRNTEELPHGWWVHDLKFYSDNDCKTQIGLEDILQSFAYGPAVSDTPPMKALDNDRVSVWKAPCVDAAQADLCGCMSQLNEGYSVSSQKCVPGEITSGYAEEICVNTGVKKQISNNHVHGCPKGGVTIGVEFRTPQEVGCVAILQDGQKKRNHQKLDTKLVKATGSFALEHWNGRGWEEVRRWTNLNTEGNYEYLPLRDDCLEYELPEDAPSWVEVLGSARGHGAKRTIRCADGEPKQVQVECVEGVWSKMPLLLCDAPSLPLSPPPQPTEAPKDSASETGASMALSIFLLMLMALVLICLLYIAKMAAQLYGQRKQRHLLYAMPEKDVEMPATRPTKPQRVGRPSSERPLSAMERRRRELGALSSSEFKAQAAMLRAQVAECVDDCASPGFKKDAEKRRARAPSPTKTTASRNGDSYPPSPGDVSFGLRQGDLGKAPQASPAPKSFRKKKNPEREEHTRNSSTPTRRKPAHDQRATNSSSPTRHQKPDESRTDRRGETPSRGPSSRGETPRSEPIQQLPPPPPVPPPPSSSGGQRKSPSSSRLPPIPGNGGGFSGKDEFRLNF